MSLSDYIANLNDLPLVPVEVPEWPDKDGVPLTVYVRIGSAGEVEHVVDHLQKLASGGRAKECSWRAWMLAHFLCDADGNKLFPGDGHKTLGKKSFKVIRRLHDIASEVNGMQSGDSADEEEDEIKKKSEEERSDSGSDYL